jgi:tetratricopeptide (TPR) repeat protein
VQKKSQLFVFAGVLLLLIVLMNVNFFGCATTGPKSKELTPEQKKAIQDSLFQIHKNELSRLFSFGFEPYKHGDYEKAKRYFRLVAEKDTSGIYGRVLYQRLGDCYLRLNIPDSAEWAYKVGIVRQPDNPYFYTALGYIYRAGGRTEEAIETYETLVELVPDSASYHKYLGELYVRVEENAKAIEEYQKTVELNPRDQESQEVLSRLLSQAGEIDKVIETQKSLVESDPENMKYRMNLAQTYHRAGEFENAIEQLKIVTSKEAENILALELLGDSYKQTDKFNDAVTIYRQILAKNKNDKKNLCNLAMCYTSLGRYTTAMGEVAKAQRIDTNYGLVYLTRGMIYEASAEKCVSQNGGKITYDDKLVYKLAYDEFQRATRDLEWKNDADRRMAYLETLIPTREDEFMHSNQKTPRGECYQWIQ